MTRARRLGLWLALGGVGGVTSAGAQATGRLPDLEPPAADDPAAAAAPPASGGTAPAPDLPRVVAPELVTRAKVPYPEGATGSAVVVLELLVDMEGAVSELVVLTGSEPFASAALTAARAWRFQPARRDGAPVAARIRIQVGFEPIPELPPEPAPPPPVDAARPAPPAPAAPIEIVVEGEKPPPGVTTLGKAEIRELPGALGDPFRAIEALPGVTPMISGLPFFFIRGAPPGNQGFFFDGIRVPLLYHLALGPGVIHPALVERVDLYAGGYPARYGRFAGGIVAAESTLPATRLTGEANVRLVDSGAYVAAPFADGRGTLALGGRYSYTARMLELFAPDFRLQYWDYQARAAWRFDARRTGEVFAFGSYDLFKELGSTVTGTEFHRIDLRHDFDPNPATHIRVAATVGSDRSRNEDIGSPVRTVLRDRLVGARVELRHRQNPTTLLRGGADFTLDHYDVLINDGDEEYSGGELEDTDSLAEYLPTRTDVATGVWGDAVLDVTPKITVIPGLRVDVYESDRAWAVGVDPRIAATFGVHERVRLVHTLGLAHQPPSFVVPLPGFNVSDLRGGLQRGVQSSAAVEVDWPEEITSSVTVFQQATFNGTDLLSTATQDESFEDATLTQRSLANTYGAELLLRRSFEQRVGWLVAYTLSRSRRSHDQFQGPSSFDRTHVLNAAAGVNLGKQWRFSSRFVWYSGIPMEVTDTVYETRPNGAEGLETEKSWLVRTAPFYRIDWRLQKRWRLGKQGGYWAFVAEVLNTTLHKEEVTPDCPDGSCTGERIGPVTVPALGVEAAF